MPLTHVSLRANTGGKIAKTRNIGSDESKKYSTGETEKASTDGSNEDFFQLGRSMQHLESPDKTVLGTIGFWFRKYLTCCTLVCVDEQECC